MILQALTELYEELNKEGKIAPEGWEPVPVSYQLNIGYDGAVKDFVSLKIEETRGKKTVLVPRRMVVPKQVKRSSGVNSNYLCENSAYMLGIDGKGNQERSLQCFQAFRTLHEKLLQEVSCMEASAIRQFLSKWEPNRALEYSGIANHKDDLMKGARILLYIEGQAATEIPELCYAWNLNRMEVDTEKHICLVTGKSDAPAQLHPIIKGIAGGQSMGTSLVSYNAPAFCSYGKTEKDQGRNSSVGQYAANAYGAALNYLLQDTQRVIYIGDRSKSSAITIVCWARDGDPSYQDLFKSALMGPESATSQDVYNIVRAVSRGDPVLYKGSQKEMDIPFYVVGFAPNAARLTLRFFRQNTFGDIIRLVQEHYDRLEIIHPSYEASDYLPLWKLLRETVNQKSRDQSPSPQMAADTLQAILTGGTYPASLINATMLRIKAEREITWGRAAIIKAYYLRNKNKDCPEEVLTVALNENSSNVPYNLGRLFSVLEQIQQDANPGINATIKDKYFNAASATPGHIFPLLINMSEKHLRKLQEGKRVYYSRILQGIMGSMGDSFPARLGLPEQGAFQLGYYHQTQQRYVKKEDR